MRSQKAHRKPHKRPCKLGGSADPIGYCRYHHNTVSINQMKRRGCEEKHCRALCKYKDHPYWNKENENGEDCEG